MAHQADHDPPVLSRGRLLLLSLQRSGGHFVVVLVIVRIPVLILVLLPRSLSRGRLGLGLLGGILRGGRRSFRSRLRFFHRHPLTLSGESRAHAEQRVGSNAEFPRRLHASAGRFIVRDVLGVGFGRVRVRVGSRVVLVVAEQEQVRIRQFRVQSALPLRDFLPGAARRTLRGHAYAPPHLLLPAHPAAAVLGREPHHVVHTRQRGEEVLAPLLRRPPRDGVHLVQHEHEGFAEPPGDVGVQRGRGVQQRVPRVHDEHGHVSPLEDAPQLAPHLDVLLKRGRVPLALLPQPRLHAGDPPDERLALAGVEFTALELVVPLWPGGHQGHRTAGQVKVGATHLLKRGGIRAKRAPRVPYPALDVVLGLTRENGRRRAPVRPLLALALLLRRPGVGALEAEGLDGEHGGGHPLARVDATVALVGDLRGLAYAARLVTLLALLHL